MISVIALACCGLWGALAQPPQKAGNEKKSQRPLEVLPLPPVVKPAPPGPDMDKSKLKELPDPTEPGPGFQEFFNKNKQGPAAPPRVPGIALKGKIVGGKQPPAVLLEVDGKLQLVTEKGELSLGGYLTIRVEEINAAEVRILVQPLQQWIVLH